MRIFKHIYSGNTVSVDFPYLYNRWSGKTIAIIDEWLNYPFYF